MTSQNPLPALPDTHIHIVPPSLRSVLEEKGDPTGWIIPEYSSALLSQFLATLNITQPILSVTTPGATILGPTDAGRKLARQLNEEVAGEVDVIVRGGRDAGFFASLPDFNDVQGVLEEIEWIFGTQKKANGVIVMTNYGDKMMADLSFRPIWEKLNQVKALIFVHPTNYNIALRKVGNFLPDPVLDYPHATTRAAVDLVISGTFRACPDIDVILSHAGGTLPFLANRAFGSLEAVQEKVIITTAEAWEDTSRFYYDLASATSPAQLSALLVHTDASKVTFGTDFPYAPTQSLYAGAASYAEYVKNWEQGKAIRPEVLMENVKKLIERHPVEGSALFKQDAYTGTDSREDYPKVAEKARKALSLL